MKDNKIVEIGKLYDAMVTEQRELRKQFQEKAQSIFNNLVSEFFNLNPSINVIGWVQYTPYFNDGESCEFGVDEPYFSNATGDDVYDISWGEYDGDNDDIWAESNFSRALKNRDRDYYAKAVAVVDAGGVNVESCNLLSKIIQSSEFEDIMKDMFGDHVSVQITRDSGIKINDYDHD